jgi:hypothetical protein
MVKKPEAKKAEVVLAKGKYIHIKFAHVIKVLTMIDEHGQSNRLAARTNGKEHTVRVPSKTVNIVKEFVAAHPEMNQHPTGKKVPRPAAKKASGGVAAMVNRASGAVRPRGGSVEPCDCSFDSGR